MFYLLGLHVGKSGRSPRVKQVQKFANYATTELLRRRRQKLTRLHRATPKKV